MKKYLLLLLAQFSSVFLLSFIAYLIRPVPVVHEIVIYALVPLFSSVSAGWIVLKGVNPYLAWIFPPIAMTLASFLSTLGIGSSPLPMMITAFVSLIGAAAGDVTIKTRKKGRK
ncbi:MAG: hypothetical protein IJN21_07490 [Clostridia bacterium]|nr:hypothetical protein [Clostridia bacterium]